MLLPASLTRAPHRAALIALVAIAAAGFVTLVYLVEHSYGAPPAGPERDKQEQDIAEIVFRYQFIHNASGRQQNAKVYFLSLRDRSPSAEFMQRFVGNKPPVSTLYECTEDDDIRDIHTDAPGILFRVQEIKWVTPTRVEVYGGYNEARLSSSGDIYYLEKREGKWIVLRHKMQWIS